MSLSVFVSPNTKTGTTTIANYVAMEIAAKTKQLTLLIEFSRYTGRSIYMQRQVVEKRRSLKNVVLNPTDVTVLQENIMISKHNKNLYFLSMNLYEDFLEMKSYASTSLTRLVNTAKGYFQHIIIDLPSDFEEPVIGAAFSKTFDHKIDHIFMVLDEDVLSFKKLYDFSAILRLGEADPLHVTYVFNKITKHYIDFVEHHLELPLIKPLNLIKLLYIDEMVDCCNKGTPKNIGTGRSAKDFKRNIQTLTDIALSGQKGTEPIVGIGIKVRKKSNKRNDAEDSNNGTDKKKSKAKPKARTRKEKQQQSRGRGRVQPNRRNAQTPQPQQPQQQFQPQPPQQPQPDLTELGFEFEELSDVPTSVPNQVQPQQPVNNPTGTVQEFDLGLDEDFTIDSFEIGGN